MRHAKEVALLYTAIAIRNNYVSLKEGFLLEFRHFPYLFVFKPVYLSLCKLLFKQGKACKKSKSKGPVANALNAHSVVLIAIKVAFN